jgi:hypothetical protein
MKFFDLENEYKGYKKFVINKKNVLKNKGIMINIGDIIQLILKC